MNNINDILLKYKKIDECYKLCEKNNIPKIRNNTVLYLVEFFKKNSFSSILEIGTGYGFSSLIFLHFLNNPKITTIEKIKENYNIANNILNIYSNIKLINIDVYEYEDNNKYDLIFLDGPKGKLSDLVLRFINNLNPNGYIIIDNFYLKKITDINNNKLSKNQLKLKEKILKFQNFIYNLKNNSNYIIDIINIDDGLVTIKKI